AQNFGGKAHFLLAPVMVGSNTLHDLLLKDPAIQPVVEKWEELTLVCFGIGALPPVPGMVVYLGEENVSAFRGMGAVGDVCAHYFDAEGDFIDTGVAERLIGVGVRQLRRARTRVAVASGVERAEAVAGALRTGLVSTLIVDAQLAAAVLDLLEG
ncbi:MAG: hypothetical protein IT323_19985, partial [Anaerolineae bacterium]|nr:hypothetical protein [Anaerolineae bacterium]